MAQQHLIDGPGVPLAERAWKREPPERRPHEGIGVRALALTMPASGRVGYGRFHQGDPIRYDRGMTSERTRPRAGAYEQG